MNAKTKKIIFIVSIVVAISILIINLCTKPVKNVDNSIIKLTPEQQRTMTYNVVEKNSTIVDNTDNNMQFSAFFTKDNQQLDGTCNKLNIKPELFINLNIQSKGSLQDGKIIIEGKNFNYSMFMIKDDVLSESYISDDVTEITLNEVKAGTNKMIFGNVIADIQNNTNNYGGESTVTLTGTYVKEDGTKVQIEKKCNITVDWYGDIKASLSTSKHTYHYDNMSSNKITFGFYVNETAKDLLLDEVLATVEIPQLNGQDPVSVECSDSSVEDTYDTNTRKLTLKCKSTIDDQGVVTKSLSRQRYFNIIVTYPPEAIAAIQEYTQLEVPITGKFIGYNNPNEEFKDEKESNLAEGKIVLEFTKTPEIDPVKPTKYSHGFGIEILKKVYVSKPSNRYILSKQDILNLYDNSEYEGDYKYTVRWYAYSGNANEIKSFKLAETKNGEDDAYGDKFDDLVIDEYTSNTGIYFSNASTVLGDNGEISVYDNDTNELIHKFTKDDWNNYNADNPFPYTNPIKHIRVETTKPAENSYLYVYNVKELDANKLIGKYTIDDMKKFSKMTTYLTGTANIVESEEKTANLTDSVYLVSETSDAKISVEHDKLLTQETTNQKIYIDTIYSQQGDSYWKNGQFIVEVPEDIIKIDIKNVSINNNDVKVVAYEAVEVDGRYLIKIITENENPSVYRITIDCDITPDSRMATNEETFTLYAYNEKCNEYYNTITDKYDVDNDNSADENVGTSSGKVQFIAPMTLVTLETITDYDNEKDNEITIAPNVADVDKEIRKAKINISLTNSYPYTVSGIKILGKIPFEGNTYIINNDVDMKSEFDTTMIDGGIKADKDEIKNHMVVYYSENENPTQDLEDEDNGWKTLEEGADFSNIKTYLIDLQDYQIQCDEEIELYYNVSLPEKISYNKTAYSNHAVFFDFITSGAKVPLSTEPAKVGVKIVSKYDLELTKYKTHSQLTIPGVTYSLTYNEKDTEGVEQTKTRIITTGINGKLKVENLHAGIKYTLKEVKVPDTCELNTKENTFIISEDGELEFTGESKSKNFDGSDTLTIELEDEVKANLQITKTKIGTDNLEINNVRFALTDEEGNKKTGATKEGKLLFTGLLLNKKYILTETATPGGIQLNEGNFEFTLVRDKESGNISIQEGEKSLLSGEATISDDDNVLTPTLNVNVKDELKYSLDLTKVDYDGNSAQGVQFVLKGRGQKEGGSTYTTTKSGKISVNGLYVGEEYTLEEVRAIGYYLDKEKSHKITFKVEREGNLKVTQFNHDNVELEGNYEITENQLDAKLSFTLKNEKIPTYNLKIVKKNENNDTLAGAQFKLKSLDTDIEQYITIDEHGNGSFEGLYEYIENKCVSGKYELTETYAPEGYRLDPTVVKFYAKRNPETHKLELIIEEGQKIASVVLEENMESDSISNSEGGPETEAGNVDGTETGNGDESEDETNPDNSNQEFLTISIVNKPIFKLKKLGDNNDVLPGAKFAITDMNGDSVKAVDGSTIGEEKLVYTYLTFKKANEHAWTQNDNGVWKSGNYHVANSTSILESNSFIIKENTTFSFDWSVSSQSTSDYLYYEIINDSTNDKKGGTNKKISGTSYGSTEDALKYTTISEELTPGTYHVKFYYYKNGSSDSGLDAGFVKNISKVYMNQTIVETDGEGIISANLPEGLYKAVEVQAPDGYELTDVEENRTYYFGIGKSRAAETTGKIDKLEWAKSVSSDYITEFKDAVKTSDGGVIAVGSTDSNTYLLNEDTKSGFGNQDGLIVKYNSDGTVAWSKILGGDGDDEILAITEDPQGGYYAVAGYVSSSSIDYDNEEITVDNYGSADGFVMKISENGDKQWCKTIGKHLSDRIDAVAINDNGDVAVTGSYYDVDINQETNTLTGTANKNGFVCVLSNSGEYSWSSNLTSTSDVLGRAITTTSDGFAVGVSFRGELSIDNNSEKITSKGNADGIVIGYNSSGTVSWKTQIGSTGNDEIYDIIDYEDSEQNRKIVAVGAFGASFDINNDGTNDLTTKGVYDGMIVKLQEENGTYEKALSIGGSSDEVITSIVPTKNGGLLFGGWKYSSSVSFNGGSNVFTSNSGINDGFIIELNSTDEIVWSDTVKGTLYDMVNGVVQAEDGSCFAVGDFQSKSLAAFDKTGILSNTSSYDSDAFILKYAQTVTTAAVPEAQEIVVKNEIKKFAITTEIGENLQGERVGGNITGIYNGEYPEVNNKKFVEKVKYGYNSTQEIRIEPITDYTVTKITINGKEVKLIPEEDGTVIIKAGYFTKMNEDKHIVVTFANISHTLNIEKVGEDGEPLEGAEFKIKSNNETPEFEEMEDNGAKYKYADTTKPIDFEDTLTENGVIYGEPDKSNGVDDKVIGDIQNNGKTYYFEKNQEDGSYKPNNKGKGGTTAYSYFKIDLTEYPEDDYQVVVTAKVYSEKNYDYGYATINESTADVEHDNTVGRFIHIAGETTDVTTVKEYESPVLEGGKEYYLHIGYRKDGSGDKGDDVFTVTGIKVYKSNTSTYNLNKDKDNKYIPTNLTKPDTIANSYIPINLAGKEGKCAIVINAQTNSASNEYLYAHITDNTDRPAQSTTTNRIMSISGNSPAKDYEFLVDGGKQYYLHLGYSNVSSSEKTVAINSINVYETKELTFDFDKVTNEETTDEEDNSVIKGYVSNNVKRNNTYAYSYIPLDLTNYYGDYKLTVNATIEGTTNDHGFVTVKTDNTAPEYNVTTNRIFDLTGTKTQEGSITLIGGTKYYIHLGYYNGSTDATNADTFTINSIKVEPVVKEYTASTNSSGKATVEVEDLGKYQIQETKAPEHYILSSDIKDVELKQGGDNETFSFINKRNPLVIVHHYLKNEKGEYTKQQVAEDETFEGEPNKTYTTKPKSDLKGLTLEKINGKYRTPENGSGTYPETGIIEVEYYYETTPMKLTIHHYLEGTEDKVQLYGKEVDDEIVYTDSIVTFDDNGNYTVSAKNTYTLNNNNNYENLLATDYVFTSVSTQSLDDEGKQSDPNIAEITDIFNYTTDSEIIYYYKLKTHVITTEVIPHTESRTDEMLNTKVDKEVDGGTITGEYNKEYPEENRKQFVEEVIQKENSKKTITATPNYGYTVKYVKVITTTDDGKKTEELLYGSDNKENNEKSSENDNNNKKVEEISKQTSEEQTEGNTNKEQNILVSEKSNDNLKEENSGSSEDGGINSSKEENLENEGSEENQGNDSAEVTGGRVVVTVAPFESVTADKHVIVEFAPIKGTVEVHHIINGKTEDYENYEMTDLVGEKYYTGPITIPHYQLVYSSENTTGKFEEGKIDVYYYYDLREYSYRVEYYYDNQIDDKNTEKRKAKYGEIIDNYVDKNKTGYQFERKEPLNEEGDLSLKISDNPEENVIKIFYERKSYEYTVEYYYDDVKDETETKHSEAKYGDKITTYEKTKKQGYRLVKETPTDENDEFGLTISENPNKNIIRIYYRSEYNITTKVKTHEEKYLNNTIKNDVRGGNISGDSTISIDGKDPTNPEDIMKPYEKVLKDDDSTLPIKIIPDDDYKIVNVWISDGPEEEKERIPLDFTKYMQDGIVTLPKGYFQDMDSNKHIEVEFRRKTKVIVRYYEKDGERYTTNPLAESEEIDGYESQAYKTDRLNITNYRGVADEDGNEEPINKEGTMMADTIEVIYYYERIPSGITVKHVEKLFNEEGEVVSAQIDGIKDETIDGYVGLPYETKRKEIDHYIPADPPESIEEKENVINVKKSEESKNGEFTEDAIEIVYWYERQFDITTEVKKHTEERENTETGEKETKEVDGGTITGMYETPYETVTYNHSSNKPIKAIPNTHYIVKSITLVSTDRAGHDKTTLIYGDDANQDAEVQCTKQSDGSVTVSNFENVKENKKIIVEFEPIKGKVIVHHYIEGTGKEFNKPEQKVPSNIEGEYIEDEILTDLIDEKYETKENQNVSSIYKCVRTSGNVTGKYTEEEIHVYYYYDYKEYKYTVQYYYDGVLNENKTDVKSVKYNTQIDECTDKIENGYVKDRTDNLPLIVKDNESENVIKVYYTSIYNITTDVIPHIEKRTNSQGQKENRSVDGGTITGQGQEPYEVVRYKENSKNEITIKPEDNYKIKSIILESITRNVTSITTTKLYGEGAAESAEVTCKINEDGSITLTNFENVTEHKNIKVEFEPIPGTVIVHHYMKETGDEYGVPAVPVPAKGGGYLQDETFTDLIGEPYETSQSDNVVDICKCVGSSDNTDGQYVKGITHVYYYYDYKDYKYTVQYYYDGVLDNEKTYEENVKYGTEIKDYRNEIKDGYVLEEVDEIPLIVTDDESHNVIKVYYTSVYNITTQVKPHTEKRTNKTTGQKEEVTVDGGKITGQGQQPYEVVKYNQNSVNPIIITPDPNYIVKSIILVSKNREENSTTTVVYDKDATTDSSTNAEIGYTENEDGTITLDNFTNVMEHKHIIVEFEPILGTVIVHHYITGTGEQFNTTPVKVPAKDGGVVENETLKDLIGEEYVTSESENIADIYEKVSSTNNTKGEFTKDTIDVYYYYDYKHYDYTIEYYYDGEKDVNETVHGSAKYGDKITEFDDKIRDGYVLVDKQPVDSDGEFGLTIKDKPDENVIRIYYRSQYKITTKVVTHTEEYSNGDVVQDVRGGTISGDFTLLTNPAEPGDLTDPTKQITPYEIVLKGDSNKQPIEIVPAENYQIVKIWISDGLNADKKELDFSSLIENESVILPIEYFTNMQSDKHIEVEFRRKTKVIVKYLEKVGEEYTKKSLLDDEIIDGYEGKEYETLRKNITYYKSTKDQNGNITPENAAGKMKADTIEVVYYYEKIPAGVTVKYVEKVVNSNGEIEGVAIDEVEDDNITGYVSESYETSRKRIENYISATPPQLPEGTENVVYVDMLEDSYNGIFTEEPFEIYYWYERVFDITTEITPHIENRTNKETGEKEEKLVDGGDISGKDEKPYETVVYKSDAEHEIVITPEDNYIIKSIKIISTNRAKEETEIVIYGDGAVQNAEISYTQAQDGTVTLSKFKNVQSDKRVVVEFEPIQGTVIVHHYINGTGEEFKNEPVKVPAEIEGTVVENQTLKDLIGEPYETSESKDVAHVYELVDVSGQVSGEFGKDEINVYYYYDFKGYDYKVEYYYDGEIDEKETETSTAKYGDKIIDYDDKVRTGYKLEKVEPTNDKDELELSITDKPEENVIKVYYVKDNFNYTVEYYYDGIIDSSKTETIEAEYQQEISKYKEKLEPGYVKVKDENVPLIVSDDVSKNVIKVYYRRQYNITTKVIEHTEEYVDGTVEEHIKGGKISGDSLASYEKVFKGENSTKAIVIEPDENYEIVKITVSDGSKKQEVLDYTKLIKDGKVTIPVGYFTNMQSDKHIEVEFRKKSNVIVKYLEKTKEGYTENELLPQEELTGYETKEYKTSRKNILNYRAAEDPDKNMEPKNATGTMKADTIEVIYYYEKIPAGITVKHLEKVTNPDGTIEGIEIQEAEDEYIKGHVGEIYKTSRKEMENYVPAEPPELDETIKNVIYVDKEKDTYDGKYTESTVQIIYWYERQFNITTQVKQHPRPKPGETEQEKPGSGEQGNQDMVKGGSISGDITAEETLDTPYEGVIKSQSNKKAIEIIPDDGYRVKELVINGKVVDTTELVKEDKSIVLPEGYFKDIQGDIHIQVEFEEIPAELIVKYIDKDTGEEIIPTEKTQGYVNDEYNKEIKELEDYILADPKPENAKGKLVEEGVTVNYYYIRQFKITTDVIEHYEFENNGVIDVVVDENGENASNNITNGTIDNTTNNATNSTIDNTINNATNSTTDNATNNGTNNATNDTTGGKILVKGGTISGEDEQPYEKVNRGKDNKKEIQIVPDEGYKIKSIRIRQPGAEIENLDLEKLLKENGVDIKEENNNKENNGQSREVNNNGENNEQTNESNKNEENKEHRKAIILKAGYFTNMQSNKHIEVEFEKIPAKITVEYLNKDTQEKVAKSEIVTGYVNDKYKTHEKQIPYYELIKEAYPENVEGKLQEETKVTYWYRRLLFNMKLTKELASVQVNGNEVLKTDKKLVKVDISNTEVQNTNILVKYKIAVQNTEEIAGTAKVLEQIPVGFKISNQMKTIKQNSSSEGQPDNSNEAQVDIWKEVGNNLELTTRELQPGETAEYEVILEWDTSKKIIGDLENIAKITETQNIPQFTETTKEDNRDSCTLLITIRTGDNTDIKVIISISCFILAGICTLGYIGSEIYLRRKIK